MGSKRLIGIIIGLGGAGMCLLLLTLSLLSNVSEDKETPKSEQPQTATLSVSEESPLGARSSETLRSSQGKPEILKVWESPHTRVKFRKNTNQPIRPLQPETESELPEYQDPESEEVYY